MVARGDAPKRISGARSRPNAALGERLERERLREAGNALEEDVAAGEERDHEPIDEGVLADDDAGDLGAQRRDPARRALGRGLQRRHVGRVAAARAKASLLAKHGAGGRRNIGDGAEWLG